MPFFQTLYQCFIGGSDEIWWQIRSCCLRVTEVSQTNPVIIKDIGQSRICHLPSTYLIDFHSILYFFVLFLPSKLTRLIQNAGRVHITPAACVAVVFGS